MSEEVEACFVLPLRETAAHFASPTRNPRRQSEIGAGFKDGNTHSSIDISTDLE
jgi:hypothetical protein